MNISTGKNPPQEINVFIEIPAGSSVKYELDKDSGVIIADRFQYTTMGFPGNYGFVPNSKAEDGDPLDVLVLASQTLYPGVVVAARPIGMLEMEDEAGVDTKIVAVPTPKVDPFMSHINDISDVEDAVKNKIKHFFDHYKELEPGKWVKTGDFKGKADAEKAIRRGLK